MVALHLTSETKDTESVFPSFFKLIRLFICL